jgi:glucosamine--fructose-6-phosphate aminotransferase (isomerizing)
MALANREQCKSVAERLNGKDHCFILGKGYGEAVAMEGALKIKEMCYLHAEGYSGGALKHGPFALIENDANGKQGATPIIMLILNDQHAHHMRTAAEEVKARGADVIIITDKKELADGLDENPLVIPSNGPMTALSAVLPIQLIAYELAMLRGINPDTPRNLAKAVTVD